MQEGYFGCIGCGRMFKLNDVEVAEYGLHDCDSPEDRLIVPENSSALKAVQRIFRKPRWR